MNAKTLLHICCMICLLIPFGCKQETQEQQSKESPKNLKEPLINANKHMVKAEDEMIRDFLARYQWDVKTSGTGLRYYIYHHGEGKKPHPGDEVQLKYTARLITGELLYTSDSNGPLVFEIGKSDVISGLQEAALLLKKGDKAKLIIPSHLAYGFTGDDNLIPPKAPLVYDVELINFK